MPFRRAALRCEPAPHLVTGPAEYEKTIGGS
jgi:hypothetical protein